jgi:SAM-dependent methyltransferase
MSTSLSALTEKYAGASFVPRAKQFILGLAADFWKDAPYDPALFGSFPLRLKALFSGKFAAPGAKKTPAMKAGATPSAQAPPQFWHAEAGEVAEKMWGTGQVWPAGDAVMGMLVRPFGVKPDHNLLDLSAGLGGALRTLAGKANLIKGLEVDQALAMRGMEMSAKAGKTKHAPISVYDPATFSMPATFDFALARELFYRIADKPAFFAAIAGCLKPGGQIAFTDFVVDPENKQKPAILAWQAHEKDARPLGLIDLAQAWARVGIELRVSEDQTAFYRQEVIEGLKRFVGFLGQGPAPDAETKRTILREVELWVYRMAAIEQGMKFYRFYALKQG